ncbi:MAG: sodium:solute symporter family protein [Candidatus Latescibacterota bacterium]|nr:sodium:solute symporter family protein [Candidatus Latescibacterota bacterium]
MMPDQSLNELPHIVLSLYLLLLLAFGIQGYRRRGDNNAVDYYLAGRGQGWIVTSLTIMATFFSSFALLGAPGMVYRDGVVFSLFSLNVPVAGVAIYLFGTRIRKIGKDFGYVTPADMISNHYGSKISLRLLVALVGLLYTVPYVVIQIQAGGIISQQLFPGDGNFEIGAVILSAITMLYIMVGGMRSVAWTDVVQGLLLVGGMFVAGICVVTVLGGLGNFFSAVSHLPPKSLTVPGTTGYWTPSMLFTASAFASLGSMIQPAQWMRFYAARSNAVLKRSALIFSAVLTLCFFFGVMLVGIGGQVLYPLVDINGFYQMNSNGSLLPNPAVGNSPSDFDQILVVVLKNHLPELFGQFGAFLAALILVAIMAAAMSTADSNLHALSALITHDIYDQFIRSNASENERAWIGRLVIALATLLALALVILGRHSQANPLGMIVALGLLAIAFSTQLLPMTVDILYLQIGTRQGAVAGLVTGIISILLLSPISPLTLYDSMDLTLELLRSTVDIGTWGLMLNCLVFFTISSINRRNLKA